MTVLRSGWWGVALGLLLATASGAQPLPRGVWLGPADLAVATDSLALAPGQLRVDLSRRPLLELLELSLDGRKMVLEEEASIVPDRGYLVLAHPARGGERLLVRYRYDPAGAVGFVQLHRPAVSDSARADPGPGLAPAERPDAEEESGPALGALRISGSKSVSVQGGTNRDATVDQALRITVAGRLTPGIGVRAEISDENLPITPEGNTEELSDLDQVRIELYGRRGRALVGDFRVEDAPGVFVPYERKLKGLWLRGRAERGSVSLLGGAPQGRRVEVELRGREGVQGPYELLDGRRLDQSFIVAGSERVWVDGEPMRRGEGRDYTIDYIRGSIRFTELRPVGPESRIAVDFETSETGYSRTVLGAQLDSLALGPVRLRLGLLQEADDSNRPQDDELSAADRETLAVAGDDPTRARGEGAVPVPPGEGDYLERFTPDGVRYFELAPPGLGDWQVVFVRVGSGEGDYRLEGATETGRLEYVWVGAGLGDYAVGRTLPLPVKTQLAVARVELAGEEEHEGFVRAEVDLSRHDANQLSDRDDEDNEDAAWRVEAATPWWAGGKAERGVRARVRAESIGGDFFSTGRLRDPFFYEPWNLQEEERDRRESYESAELVGRWDQGTSRASLEHLRRSGSYDGLRARWGSDAKVAGPLRLSGEMAFTTADRPAERKSRRRERTVTARVPVRGLRPFARWTDQRFTDSLPARERGYRYGEWAAGVGAGNPGQTEASLEFRRLVGDSLRVDGTAWKFARDVRHWTGQASGRFRQLRVGADVSWRSARQASGADETTRLLRVNVGRPAMDGGLGVDLGYRAGTDQSRVLGRQIVFVGLGEGDYDAEGRLVGVNQGDYNLVYTPGDSLVASTEVEFSAQVDWRPRRSWLGGIASHTLLLVRERSRSSDVGGLLRLSPSLLRQEDTTVFGEERLRQELLLLRQVRRFDLRLSLDRVEALDQRFTQGPETTLRRQRQARLESDLGRGWTLRLEGGEERRVRDAVPSANPLLRSYEVQDLGLAGTLRYRIDARRRAALELRWTDRDERVEAIVQTVLELVPSFTTDLLRGRWTVQTRLAEVRESGGDDTTRPFFFERPGTGRSASVLAQWGAGGSMTVSLRWQLRDEPDRPLRQDLAVETRARF